jgi:glycosidase
MNTLRNQMIYQVFVRNYSSEGTFTALTNDLKRIKELGTDILYLMPIHPIGELNRKGTMGSPYAIKDYYGISQDLGTLDDFKALIKQAHALNLKVMIDIVFHHTAPDHLWVKEYPHFYVYKQGKLANKVGDWSDIADFEFDNNPELLNKLTDVLLYWTKLGVDGYRFDVASMIPKEFFEYAFPKVDALNPDTIYLAESVDANFVDYLRYHNHTCLSDAELYQYFDILYDYDNQVSFMGYLRKEKSFSEYISAHQRQERIYPVNYVKARNVENHDNPRIHAYTQNRYQTLNWLAYVFMAKGIAFIHFGVETLTSHMSYLFEKDPVDFTKMDSEIVFWIKSLANLKKKPIFAQNYGYKIVSHQVDILHFEYENNEERFIAICNISNSKGMILVDIPEGEYRNLITNELIDVRFNQIELSNYPILFSIKKAV